MADAVGTPTSTRVSAAQINVAATVTDLDGSLRVLRVERMDNAGAVVVIFEQTGINAPGTFNTSDTGVQANNKYAYRSKLYRILVGGTLSLVATSAWCGYVHTSPAVPGPVTVSRNGTTVTVTWQDGSAVAQGSGVSRSDNGGAYGAETIYDGVVGGNAAYTGISTTDTHQYRVRHFGNSASAGGSGNRFFTDYALSPLMPVCVVPNAPTLTVPAQADRTQPLTVGVQHHPADYHVQTAGNLRYRLVGAGAWTTVSIGTNPSYTFAANALPSGSYEFQAQTQGLTALGMGAWSASSVAAVTSPPTANITSPATGGTVTTARITLSWGYYDPEGTAQAAWAAQIVDNGTGAVVWSARQAGPAGTFDVPYTHADGGSYTASVQVQDGAGAWSAWTGSAYTVSYVPPPAPGVVSSFNPDTGAATLTITNPAPGGGQVAAVSNSIYRDGSLIAEDLPLNSTYTDPVPALNSAPSYRVVAVSAGYTTASTTVTVNTTLGERRWVFLNGGSGYTLLGRMREQVAITASPDRDKSLVLFEGRTLPVEYAGQGITRAFRVSGEVRGMGADPDLIGTWEPFAQLSELPAPLLFRDPLGRRVVCSTSAWSIMHDSQGPEASVSFTVTEVDQT